jgi:hypothetical protein
MSDIDDDLKNLLDQLDDQDISEENSPPEKPDIQDQSALHGTATALRPIEEPIRVQVEDQPNTEQTIAISKYLDKMDMVADEVLQSCRSDRQEAQEVIDMLRNQCQDAHARNQSPARMYVDGLVKAVEVKANINTNAVKVMEGVAKMIAATKSGLNIQNNNVTVSATELDEVLKSTHVSGELD